MWGNKKLGYVRIIFLQHTLLFNFDTCIYTTHITGLLKIGKEVALLKILKSFFTVRSFLSRMGKVAFFRAGKEPLVLTAKERELKKTGKLFSLFYIILYFL